MTIAPARRKTDPPATPPHALVVRPATRPPAAPTAPCGVGDGFSPSCVARGVGRELLRGGVEDADGDGPAIKLTAGLIDALGDELVLGLS